MKQAVWGVVTAAALASCAAPGRPLEARRPPRAAGPLRVLSTNPRYFTADGRTAVYLTGSHTWFDFQDGDSVFPPRPTDYPAFLTFLTSHNLDFFRLWTWEQGSGVSWRRGLYAIAPLPYARSGNRYDLTTFDTAYFSRLRREITAARDRGIYVSVMLFNGFSVDRKHGAGDPWAGHPFHRGNNTTGVDGDPDGRGDGRATQSLTLPAVMRLQVAYVRRVIDAVGDLENVLYEIVNEGDTASAAWQAAMLAEVRRYEARRHLGPHPVGLTVDYPGGSNAALVDGAADWIAPNGDVRHPPTADGRNVILWDTDHLCGTCAPPGWAWKAFLSGLNPIFMDPYDQRDVPGYDPADPAWERSRREMGQTLTYAQRLDLASATPQGGRASTGYCLADTAAGGAAYLAYVPGGARLQLAVAQAPAPLTAEWLDPETERVVAGDPVEPGGVRTLNSPISGDAVLFLHLKGRP
ncbi:MAG TPA: hypothetical protein VFD85_13775 [Gemmatimonadales bacterium]|nr:hypothetical protein [Gemmatimonadales bacterium]